LSSADEELKAEFDRHAQALKQYEAEIEHLEDMLDGDQKEHLSTEQDHKRKLTRIEDETAKTISDYDYQMTEKTRTYTRLKEMYEAESASLRSVSAKATELVAERTAYEKAIAEEEARVAALALLRHNAAVKIQSLIRGFLVRRRLKREREKAAGKKGGKKAAPAKKK
jgi:chromosome segregation ATPase